MEQFKIDLEAINEILEKIDKNANIKFINKLHI